MILSLITNELKRSIADASGFGFVGLLFLILILSIGTVATITTLNMGSREVSITTKRAAVLRSALSNYRTNHGGASAGSYPPNLDSLVTTDAVPCNLDNVITNVNTYLTLQGWCGPYIDQPIAADSAAFKTDGWGTLFQFVTATGILTSCGTDRTCGNADDVTFNP